MGDIAPTGKVIASARSATMTAPAAPGHAGKFKVFISYSRVDEAFADELLLGLQDHDFEVSLDRHSIREGETWKERLDALITNAGTVVFVLSPDSAHSTVCQWEVDHAHDLGKRIIPVLWRGLNEPLLGRQPDGKSWPPNALEAPRRLAALNYVRFDKHDDGRPRSFMTALHALVGALEMDLDWLRQHTWLLTRVREWQEAGQPGNRLLSGNDIGTAKTIINDRKPNFPPILPMQLDYLRDSEMEETRRQSAEEQRLRDLAEAQEARAKALEDTAAALQREAGERTAREEAQSLAVELAKREAVASKREATASRMATRVTMLVAGIALALAITALGFGWYTELRQGEAVEFPIALAWQSLGVCIIGVLIGMLLGATTGMAAQSIALVPLLVGSNLTGSFALCAGLYYGGQFGRSISAILLGVPGGASALATTFDGYPMANQGQAGRALGVTLLSMLVGSTVATVFIAALTPPMSGLVLQFAPAEYVAITVLSLAIAVAVAGGAPPKALVMAFLGLLLSCAGTDISTGQTRFTFGLSALDHGLSGYAILLGLIIFPALFVRLKTASAPIADPNTMGPILLQMSDLREVAWPMLRGSLVGMLIGLLPMGPLFAPFVAYRLEQFIASDRSRFGNGAIEGLAATEAANNAGAQAALISLLVFGLSHNTVTQMMLGTLMINGAVPGPAIAAKSPELFWGSIAVFWMASLVAMLVGMGLVRALAKLVLLPRRYVLIGFFLICCAFAYSMSASLIVLVVAALIGLAAIALKACDFEPMPLLIGFFLGQMLEVHLRRTLLLSRGNLAIFVERPISGAVLLIALIVLALAFWNWLRCVMRAPGSRP